MASVTLPGIGENNLQRTEVSVRQIAQQISDILPQLTFTQTGAGALPRTIGDKLRDIVSAADFPTLQQACDALLFGGYVFLPPGTYSISSQLTVPAGVILVGCGPYGSTIITSNATANLASFDTSSGAQWIKFAASVTKTAGFHANIIGNGVTFENCDFTGYYIAASAGTIGGTQVIKPRFVSCSFFSPAVSAGSGAIQFLNFSNAIVDGCVLSGPALPATQPDFGLRFQNGDTAFVSNTNATIHGKALLVDPPAANGCYALTINGCVFDSAGTITGGSAASSAEFIPAGGVYNTRICNTWFGLSQAKFGCYMSPSGTGVVDGITFTGCEFTSNAESGLIADGIGVQNWIVTGGHSGGNTHYGIRAAGATKYFTITGHRAGNIAGRGPNDYGIVVDNATTSDYYVITNNNLVGNTTSGLFDGGTGTHKVVANNL